MALLGASADLQNAGKKLLVLDLDETLINSSTRLHPSVPFDFELPDYFVYKRPYLDQFLEELSSVFVLAVWTSADKEYADAIVEEIFRGKRFQPCFVWSYSRCTLRRDPENGVLVGHKRLKKIKKHFKISLSQVIMLDDSPEKLTDNYGNLVRVDPFEGSYDSELLDVIPFLKTLAQAEDVRMVEKRYWHTLSSRIQRDSSLTPT
mmetsp:Transcript_4818/g.7711  ORF Transcript_4818/g.7711 Transcript_4818/m.7711 type:complete len:205 (+) Transcript_4818:263-877(+)|eukprot:CAMPEP_0184295444 /NCGR_PEP_ID=MMETSP1049-20130417/6281_1 /TAXON_ID=77928 /ORGANISM="Proteomonas sulcata, Strain CCMP704" /LENGTH=204 /DNA_ID=CAMNT_0026603945 /DNA_START=312 /DNA_END=926 /DNA_ORIENTATION=+